jgi:hypothetical protein
MDLDGLEKDQAQVSGSARTTTTIAIGRIASFTFVTSHHCESNGVLKKLHARHSATTHKLTSDDLDWH